LDVKNYDHLKLGYAVTTHKSQGVTIENSYILAGGPMQDREFTYVQASRARGISRIFVDRDEAGDELVDLVRSMNKSRQKNLAHDIAASATETTKSRQHEQATHVQSIHR
ncbi:MAG TPA: hypothetical protein PLP17_17040, partial [Oligoflexia bacterium]|nr:hypothetical protein [Oligoflexia bacterium]